jgi:hypothetical protein
MELYGLAHFAGAHANACALCCELRPLARLVEELSSYQSEKDQALTGLPVEVFLQFRSCGCRNHPDIVAASKPWPVGGPKPSELCGRGSTTLCLVDAGEINSLSQALSRSAAVLDGEEIYTCFMRPILDLGRRGVGPLAMK